MTQEVKNYYTLKEENPNVSMPQDGTEVILTVWFVVHVTPKPAYDTDTQKLEAQAPIKTGGIYKQEWGVKPLTQQELDDNLTASISSAISTIKRDTRDFIMTTHDEDEQRNSLFGFYTQEISECIKQQVANALAENDIFKNEIVVLTKPSDVQAYLNNIVRATLDECRPVGVV